MVEIKRNNIIALVLHILIAIITFQITSPLAHGPAKLSSTLIVLALTTVLYLFIGRFLYKQVNHITNLLSVSSILCLNLLLLTPLLIPSINGLPGLFIPLTNNGFFYFIQEGLKVDWTFSTVIVGFIPTFVIWIGLELFGKTHRD